jgi:hypothetical protein
LYKIALGITRPRKSHGHKYTVRGYVWNCGRVITNAKGRRSGGAECGWPLDSPWRPSIPDANPFYESEEQSKHREEAEYRCASAELCGKYIPQSRSANEEFMVDEIPDPFSRRIRQFIVQGHTACDSEVLPDQLSKGAPRGVINHRFGAEVPLQSIRCGPTTPFTIPTTE